MTTNTNRVPTFPERVERLEQIIQGLANVIDENNQKQREAVGSVIEVISAIIKCSGDGFDKKVEETIIADRKARVEQDAEQAKKNLEAAVAAGQLVSVPVCGPGTVIVGRQFDKDGNLVGVGRAQVEFERFVPEAREKLTGQGPGFVYEGPNGKFEVTEIYQPAPKPEVGEQK